MLQTFRQFIPISTGFIITCATSKTNVQVFKFAAPLDYFTKNVLSSRTVAYAFHRLWPSCSFLKSYTILAVLAMNALMEASWVFLLHVTNMSVIPFDVRHLSKMAPPKGMCKTLLHGQVKYLFSMHPAARWYYITDTPCKTVSELSLLKWIC